MTSPSGRRGDSRQAVTTDAADAMLGIALAALWADGRETPSEVGALHQEIARLEVFAGLPAAHVTSSAADLREAYAQDGVDAYLEARASVLDETQALQALTLALDVVLADREVTDEELSFIDDLRSHLGIDDAQATQVIDVLETKHGLALEVTTGPGTDEGTDRFIVPSEANLAFAVGAARAAALEDHHHDRAILAPLRARGRISEKTFDALVDRVQQRLGAGDVDAYLAACADRLDEDEREHAFAWAADIALGDKRLSQPEHSYLTEIRELLGVEPSRASRIVDVLWAKHLR